MQLTWQVVPEHVSVEFVIVLQVAQVPPQHSPPVPHGVLSATLVLVATHVCVPVAQDVMPVLQGFEGGMHGTPAAHAWHDPAVLQTLPAPQSAPASTLEKLAHIDVPVEHENVPILQGLLGDVHWPLATHATQPPSSQTLPPPASHEVPLAA